MRSLEPEGRDQLRERLIQKIRDACPTPEQCDETELAHGPDEDGFFSCFDVHPIHWSVREKGVITMIDARVEGLVDLIMEEIWPDNSTKE